MDGQLLLLLESIVFKKIVLSLELDVEVICHWVAAEEQGWSQTDQKIEVESQVKKGKSNGCWEQIVDESVVCSLSNNWFIFCEGVYYTKGDFFDI